MYLSETLARERHRDQLERAQEARLTRHAAQLRKLERARQRAERKLIRAWRRSDEIRALLDDEWRTVLETVA